MSAYSFQTLTVPLRKNPNLLAKVFFRPTTGVVTGTLVGVWLAAYIVVGQPYMEVFIIATLGAYGFMGGLVGYTLNKHVFYRQILKQTEAYRTQTLRLVDLLPYGWELPTGEAEKVLNKETATVFDSLGLKWDIIDSFQDDKELHLIVRRDND